MRRLLRRVEALESRVVAPPPPPTHVYRHVAHVGPMARVQRGLLQPRHHQPPLPRHLAGQSSAVEEQLAQTKQWLKQRTLNLS